MVYRHFIGDWEEKRIRYTFNIDKITYGIEERNFVFIQVCDIVIYHNRNAYCCNGEFEEVQSGWNHTIPKAMLKQIKKDSYIINEYIKNIKKYIKTNDTVNNHKYIEEQNILNELFK